MNETRLERRTSVLRAITSTERNAGIRWLVVLFRIFFFILSVVPFLSASRFVAHFLSFFTCFFHSFNFVVYFYSTLNVVDQKNVQTKIYAQIWWNNQRIILKFIKAKEFINRDDSSLSSFSLARARKDFSRSLTIPRTINQLNHRICVWCIEIEPMINRFHSAKWSIDK